MRIRMNDDRKRAYGNLVDASDESTKSKALDAAARYYVDMAGATGLGAGPGAVEQLMRRATEQGSVTPAEIAEMLDTDELPVEYRQEWSVGQGDE